MNAKSKSIFAISHIASISIDSFRAWRYNDCSSGPIAQLGERYNGIVEVKGSSPFRSTSRC